LEMKKGGANSVGTTVPGDGVGSAIAYTTGPFTVGYGTDTSKNTALKFNTPSQLASAASDATVIEAASTTASLKNSATGLSYNAGFATLSYLGAKSSLNSDSVKSTTYAVGVPIGATNIGYSTSTGTTNNGGTETKYKSSQLQVSYALSKRTKAYFQSGSFSANVGSDKLSQQGVGIGTGCKEREDRCVNGTQLDVTETAAHANPAFTVNASKRGSITSNLFFQFEAGFQTAAEVFFTGKGSESFA